MEQRELEPFTIIDVLGDAWRSLRRTVGTHMIWNGVFMALFLVSTCVLSCAMFPVMMGMGAAGDEGIGVGVVIVGALYVGLLVLTLGMMALHQAVTLAITGADARGEPIDFGTAFRVGISRAPAMMGAMLLRVGADMVVWVGGFGLLAAAAFAMTDAEAWATANLSGALGAGMVAAFVIVYLAALVWMLVVRSFLGLSGPCVQHEELGPLDAARRSIELLAGHRLQLVAVRVLWALMGFVLYAVTYAPMGLLVALPQFVPEAAVLAILALPYMVVWYFFVLHMLSFDTAIEDAMYARLARPRTAEDLAHVFA